MLNLTDLRAFAESGAVDTVLVAAPDLRGRLRGKHCTARHFLDDVATSATIVDASLLASEPERAAGAGTSSLDIGYADLVLRPDLDTLRLTPWRPGAATVLCDVEHDGAPRQVLREQVRHLAERGLHVQVGFDIEFVAFEEDFAAARHRGYRGLTDAAGESLLRRLREELTGAGVPIESTVALGNGRHRVTVRPDEPLTACDNLALVGSGAGDIAAQEGHSLSFMSKFDAREGNSCRIRVHLGPYLGEGEDGFSATMAHFLAGQLACLRDFTYLFAPSINSYKRFATDGWAPTAVAWSRDNRTCALRVVGHGERLRLENRVPGGDVNPYLAVAAMLAAGLHGIDNRLDLEPAHSGNAYSSTQPTLPRTLRDAADLFGASAAARHAFGDDMVTHYLNAAWSELAAFDHAVTSWEHHRGFGY